MKTGQKRIVAVLLGVLLAGVLAGCLSNDPTTGYTAKSQYRQGIRTVAVPIWTRGKDIYRRDIEIRLTESLVKRIELDTPYKVTTKQRADTILTGTLEKITQRTMSFDPDSGDPREMQITFTVSFKWEDLRTGKIIVKRQNFDVAGIYLPPVPFNEDFFQGSEDLLDKLARRVVETMESDW